MKEGGLEANISSIDDYFDRNEVSYPGFGVGAYRLDRVVFKPWAKGPVAGAGPIPEGCGDQPPTAPPPPGR